MGQNGTVTAPAHIGLGERTTSNRQPLITAFNPLHSMHTTELRRIMELIAYRPDYSATIHTIHASADPDNSPRLLYDRKQAARQLSISTRSLDYIIAGKGLETRRIGKKVRSEERRVGKECRSRW